MKKPTSSASKKSTVPPVTQVPPVPTSEPTGPMSVSISGCYIQNKVPEDYMPTLKALADAARSNAEAIEAIAKAYTLPPALLFRQ